MSAGFRVWMVVLGASLVVVCFVLLRSRLTPVRLPLQKDTLLTNAPAMVKASGWSAKQETQSRHVTLSYSPAPSLQGSELDGEIEVDSLGQLVVTRGLRRRFDYLLSQVGEKTLTEIRSDLAESTALESRAEVLIWYDRYLRLLERVPNAIVGQPPVQRLERLHALREQLLGQTVAQTFYQDEEDEDRASLEQTKPQAILSPLEALHSLESRSGSFSPNELAAERAALFGEAAARRLAELEKRRAAQTVKANQAPEMTR